MEIIKLLSTFSIIAVSIYKTIRKADKSKKILKTKKNMVVKSWILTVVLMSIKLTAFTQVQVVGTFSNRNIGFGLFKNSVYGYYGFGATFFHGKGNKGQDYTNFIQPNSDVYEVLSSADGSLYGLYGTKYRDVYVNARVGLGTRKWIYNGTTNQVNWYVVKDGGTYLLYGGEIRKVINKVVVGISYDNFNKGSIIIGYSFNNYK